VAAFEALAEHLAQALLPAGLGAYHAGRGAATTGRLDARRADMPDTVVGQYRGADRRGLLDADADRQARLQLLTRGEIEDLRNRIELGPGQNAPDLAAIGTGVDLDRHLARILGERRHLEANPVVEDEGLGLEQTLMVVVPHHRGDRIGRGGP